MMRLSQTEILERAERLASTLAAGPVRVEKNVLLAVVADFMSDRQPDREKLRRTLKRIADGSGGHVERSGGYGAQVKTVVAVLGELLDAEPLETEDYRSLFGWTARLLLVRGLPPAANSPGRGAPPKPRGSKQGSAPKPPPRPGPLGAIGQKGLTALQQMKRDLEGREKNGKK